MQQDWNHGRAGAIVEGFKSVKGGLLPALHALQSEFGYVDDSVMPMLAKAFNLSNADVYGVITYYHDFKRSKPGRNVIKICRAEACKARGADALATELKAHLRVDFHGVTDDGKLSFDPVFCLGNCALAPAIQINNTLHGRVTIERAKALLEGLPE